MEVTAEFSAFVADVRAALEGTTTAIGVPAQVAQLPPDPLAAALDAATGGDDGDDAVLGGAAYVEHVNAQLAGPPNVVGAHARRAGERAAGNVGFVGCLRFALEQLAGEHRDRVAGVANEPAQLKRAKDINDAAGYALHQGVPYTIDIDSVNALIGQTSWHLLGRLCGSIALHVRAGEPAVSSFLAMIEKSPAPAGSELRGLLQFATTAVGDVASVYSGNVVDELLFSSVAEIGPQGSLSSRVARFNVKLSDRIGAQLRRALMAVRIGDFALYNGRVAGAGGEPAIANVPIHMIVALRRDVVEGAADTIGKVWDVLRVDKVRELAQDAILEVIAYRATLRADAVAMQLGDVRRRDAIIVPEPLLNEDPQSNVFCAFAARVEAALSTHIPELRRDAHGKCFRIFAFIPCNGMKAEDSARVARVYGPFLDERYSSFDCAITMLTELVNSSAGAAVGMTGLGTPSAAVQIATAAMPEFTNGRAYATHMGAYAAVARVSWVARLAPHVRGQPASAVVYSVSSKLVTATLTGGRFDEHVAAPQNSGAPSVLLAAIPRLLCELAERRQQMPRRVLHVLAELCANVAQRLAQIEPTDNEDAAEVNDAPDDVVARALGDLSPAEFAGLFEAVVEHDMTPNDALMRDLTMWLNVLGPRLRLERRLCFSCAQMGAADAEAAFVKFVNVTATNMATVLVARGADVVASRAEMTHAALELRSSLYGRVLPSGLVHLSVNERLRSLFGMSHAEVVAGACFVAAFNLLANGVALHSQHCRWVRALHPAMLDDLVSIAHGLPCAVPPLPPWVLRCLRAATLVAYLKDDTVIPHELRPTADVLFARALAERALPMPRISRMQAPSRDMHGRVLAIVQRGPEPRILDSWSSTYTGLAIVVGTALGRSTEAAVRLAWCAQTLLLLDAVRGSVVEVTLTPQSAPDAADNASSGVQDANVRAPLPGLSCKLTPRANAVIAYHVARSFFLDNIIVANSLAAKRLSFPSEMFVGRVERADASVHVLLDATGFRAVWFDPPAFNARYSVAKILQRDAARHSDTMTSLRQHLCVADLCTATFGLRGTRQQPNEPVPPKTSAANNPRGVVFQGITAGTVQPSWFDSNGKVVSNLAEAQLPTAYISMEDALSLFCNRRADRDPLCRVVTLPFVWEHVSQLVLDAVTHVLSAIHLDSPIVSATLLTSVRRGIAAAMADPSQSIILWVFAPRFIQTQRQQAYRFHRVRPRLADYAAPAAHQRDAVIVPQLLSGLHFASVKHVVEILHVSKRTRALLDACSSARDLREAYAAYKSDVPRASRAPIDGILKYLMRFYFAVDDARLRVVSERLQFMGVGRLPFLQFAAQLVALLRVVYADEPLQLHEVLTGAIPLTVTAFRGHLVNCLEQSAVQPYVRVLIGEVVGSNGTANLVRPVAMRSRANARLQQLRGAPVKQGDGPETCPHVAWMTAVVALLHIGGMEVDDAAFEGRSTRSREERLAELKAMLAVPAWPKYFKRAHRTVVLASMLQQLYAAAFPDIAAFFATAPRGVLPCKPVGLASELPPPTTRYRVQDTTPAGEDFVDLILPPGALPGLARAMHVGEIRGLLPHGLCLFDAESVELPVRVFELSTCVTVCDAPSSSSWIHFEDSTQRAPRPSRPLRGACLPLRWTRSCALCPALCALCVFVVAARLVGEPRLRFGIAVRR